MKNTFYILLLLILLFSFKSYCQEKDKGFIWNLEKEKNHNLNRNDSTKISKKNWETDIAYIKRT